MKLGEVEDFARNVNIKSVMMVGNTVVDVKSSIGWTYVDNPDGYLYVQFIYDSGTVINAELRNRNDFCKFLLQTEIFMDDVNLMMPSMQDFIKEIENEYKTGKPDEEIKKCFYATPKRGRKKKGS